MLIQDAVTEFLRSRKAVGCSKATLAMYRQEIGLFVRHLLGQGLTDTAQLTPAHIAEYLAAAYDRGVAPTTLHSYRARIAAFVNWLGEGGHCPEAIMRKVHRVRPGDSVRKTLAEDEVRAMLEFARLRPNPYHAAFDQAVLMLLLDTGIRIGELCGLSMGDLGADGRIKVRGKGNKERYVAACTLTWDMLRRYLMMRGQPLPDDPVFLSSEGQPATPHGIYQRLRRLGQRIGVKISPHMLRHTFAYSALRNGASPKDLQFFLGHTKLATTDGYLQGFGNLQAVEDHQKFSPVSGMFQH